jgi:stage IV sporulation protein B
MVNIMKKLLIVFILFIIPVNIYAYSDYVYRGGNTIGIEINTDGILIVGFYPIDGKYNKGELKNGDYITNIEDISINKVSELRDYLSKYTNKDEINITIRRNNKKIKTKLKLIYKDNIYKTGLYVKDNITGIGTLTYVDPESNIYGALGHEIIESTSGNLIEIKDGDIFRNYITSINKSNIGTAGSKNAKYYNQDIYGNILSNSINGIFGIYKSDLDNLELLKVGTKKDIKIGTASIYTVIDGEKIEEYKIDITSINETSNIKNITFKITDEYLINKTGGVIQGMSGSPIVQNNMLVGVITHVIVDNPATGYGLFITKMLEEGDKLK